MRFQFGFRFLSAVGPHSTAGFTGSIINQSAKGISTLALLCLISAGARAQIPEAADLSAGDPSPDQPSASSMIPQGNSSLGDAATAQPVERTENATASSDDSTTYNPSPSQPPPVEASVRGERNPKDVDAEHVRQTQWSAHLLRRQSAEFLVKGLHFDDMDFPVFYVVKDGELRPTIAVRGHFDHPGWRIAVQEGPKKYYPLNLVGPENVFTVPARLKGRINEIVFVAEGPKGELETEHVYIYAPTAIQFKVVSPWDQILLSLGFNYFIYSQSSFGRYESLNGLLSARYQTPTDWSKWGLFASGDMSVLTLVASPTENGPQLLQVKLDATYRFEPSLDKRWTFTALAGGSYLTMFTYGAPFGFSDLVAPEVGVRARKALSPLTALFFDARYMPLGSGITDLGEYGFNLSAAWSKVVNQSHRVEFGIDYSQYSFTSGADQLRVNSLTARLGLSI